MSFLFDLMDGIISGIQGLIGFGQRQIGREQQQNDDAEKTISQLEAEKDAGAARPDVPDELREHRF